jgi:hypothetical protein
MIGDSNKIKPALLLLGFWALLLLFDLGSYLKRAIYAIKVYAIITDVCHYKLPCLSFSNRVIILDIIRFDIDTCIQEHVNLRRSHENILLLKFMYLGCFPEQECRWCCVYLYIRLIKRPRIISEI